MKTRTIRHHADQGNLPLFTLAVCIGAFFSLFTYYKFTPKTNFCLPVVESLLNPTPTAEPTPAVQTFTQLSPDGTKKLTLVATLQEDQTKMYTFTSSDVDGSNQVTIYTTTLPLAESMSIPFNAWSPDDRYIFITHTTGDLHEALVFRADGKPLTEADKYHEVAATFTVKKIPNTYQETTGWASETLLIINTETANKTVQSYWFEVPSKAIIPLATQFYD